MEYHSGGSLPLLGRPRYCPGANANGGYLCETGHCCGETGCCTYYYELWWFWLLWTVLILFSCCCAYRHRRAKQRVQQQQRQREISLLAYHGANSYPSSMLDLSFLASLKLPSYEEVAAQPSTPPPPYSSVFTTPRYPQPPRAADPHLLTQHDPLLHRPYSDGPSSLSSDNSSSCSCDSCCPSSPCSSSLSAPVTYETDTSHASTPSEATPLTIDVTMETIVAAASCLEANKTQFAADSLTAAVSVEIGEGAQEPVATESSVANQTVTVAVVTRTASPQPLSSPGTDVTLSIGTTSPIKERLDLTPCTPIDSTCSPSTLPSPNTTIPTIQIICLNAPEVDANSNKIASNSGPSSPTASTSDSCTDTITPETLILSRTSDTANNSSSPVSVPSQDVVRTLALITGSADLATSDPNPSLVPIPASSNLTQAAATGSTILTQCPSTALTNLSQDLEPEPKPTNLTILPAAVLANLSKSNFLGPTRFTQAPDTLPATLSQDLDPEQVPANITLLPEQIPTNLTTLSDLVPSNTTPLSDPIPSNLTPLSEPVPSNLTPVSDRKLSNLTPLSEPVPSNLIPLSDSVPLNLSLLTDPVSSNPTIMPDSTHNPVLISKLAYSDCPAIVSRLDPAEVPASSSPSLIQSPSESDLIHSLSCTIDAQGSFSLCSRSNSAISSRSCPLSVPVPVLPLPTVPTSSSSSFCPAINIESDFSLAPSQSSNSPSSPSSLPSPSLPAPTLFLDPLTALHQSDKGGSSSGHASSLSPSPRATQSPPKQTLFSPCVDVFEPGPPNWEEGEEEQEEDENNDDEDEDMGADESQYRHRRLTGDSGIEVCRCRVEEENEEEEGETKEGGRRGGGVEKDNTDLHDSVDCPARGQITPGEGLILCNPNSTTTPTPEDSGKVIIVVETV